MTTAPADHVNASPSRTPHSVPQTLTSPPVAVAVVQGYWFVVGAVAFSSGLATAMRAIVG